VTIYEPAVTPETEKAWETRREFRDDMLDYLGERLAEEAQTIESGSLEGLRIVSAAQWRAVLNEARNAPLPPVSNHSAEVVTGATVLVWAKCPRCHIAGPIALTIDPELRVDDASAELRLRAKAKPRTHVCGQLTIPVGPAAEGQESFELEDIVGPHCGKPTFDGEGWSDGGTCHLPEGHEGECAPAPAEEVLEEETGATTPAEVLAKTPEEAAADVATKRSRRRAHADPTPVETTVDDDLLPGENLGACPWPGCELASGHPGAHQTAVDDTPDAEGA
jgi:hypothetical protein